MVQVVLAESVQRFSPPWRRLHLWRRSGRGISHPSIRPAWVDYAVSELAFTQLTVLDTLEVMLVETAEKLELKARRLKWALVNLTAGAVLAAVDLLLG